MRGSVGAVVVLVMAVGRASARAQEPPSALTAEAVPEGAKYSVAGRIVSARDGHPLQGAMVRLLDAKQAAVASASADREGKFAFEGIAAGSYPLQGKMPGYTTANYDQHGTFSTAIVTGAGVDTESLVLKLTPEALLSGHVLDEQGEPVRHAQVALYQESVIQGQTRTTRSRTAQTNDLGEYEFARLAPGRYYVSATATPWYAVHPQPAVAPMVTQAMPANGNQAAPNQAQMQQQALMKVLQARLAAVGAVESIDPSFDVAYPITFYAGATDSSGAEAIAVQGADQTGIDLRLVPVPAVTLTIPHPPNDRNGFPPLQRQVFDSVEQVNGETRGTPSEYSIAGIAPGPYMLRQSGNESAGAGRETTVELTGRSTTLDAGWGQELANLKVSVQGTDGAKLSPVQVMLVAKGSRDIVNAYVNQKGEAQADGVKPGDYSFNVSSGRTTYFVTKLLVAGQPVAGGSVHVAAGTALSVTVVAAAGTGSVEGFARKDGAAAGGAMVVLLPADEALPTQHAWRDQSDLDGSFHLRAIPPGRYLLLAIANGWDVEWQRAEVLARYLAGAVPVTVPESGKAAVKLAEAVAVQER